MVIRKEIRRLNICQVLHMHELRDTSLIGSDRALIDGAAEGVPGGRYGRLVVARQALLSPKAPTCDEPISRGHYSVWWDAVDWIRTEIYLEGGLMSVQVTTWMPPRRPWSTVTTLGVHHP